MTARTARVEETHTTRADGTRPKRWTRPGRLDAPTPPAGVKYRWIREKYVGEADETNVLMREREGYVPLTKEEAGGYPTKVGGLILCKIDKEISDDRERQIGEVTRAQMRSVNETLGRELQEDKRMPVIKTHKSRTTFGQPRPTSFQD